MIPRYPAGDFDSASKVAASLGTFWSRVFGDQGLLLGLGASASDAHRQSTQAELEARNALSVHSLDLFRLWHWYPYVVTSQMRNSDISAVPLYGEGWVYGDDIEYGVAAKRKLFSFTAPAGLVKVAAITGRTKDAGETWVHGVDFWLKDGRLTFLKDPIASGHFAVKEFGDVQECLLLLAEAEFDEGRLHQKYGFLLGSSVPSTEKWKEAVQAFTACATLGPSCQRVRAFLSAAFGIPIAKAGGTVSFVAEDAAGTWISVGDDLYSFPAGAEASVEVGDVVSAGDTLVTGLTIVDGCSASDPITELPGLVVKNLLFNNEDVVPEYLGIRDGKAEVRFEVRGDAGAVAQFWEATHARGVAAGRTIADFLDTRTTKVGEPRAENMPATVNPMLLLYGVLGANTYVHVDADISSGMLGSPALAALHKVLPPFAGFVVNVEVSAEDESSGYTESEAVALVVPESSDSPDSYFQSRPVISTT